MRRITCVLCLLLFCCATAVFTHSADTQQATAKAKTTAASVLTKQEQQRQEAMLTDATNLYRICGTRVQRIVPSQGAKQERAAGHGTFARRHIMKPLYHLHDSRRRLETAPFCLAASCSYYVIALRHIIR